MWFDDQGREISICSYRGKEQLLGVISRLVLVLTMPPHVKEKFVFLSDIFNCCRLDKLYRTPVFDNDRKSEIRSRNPSKYKLLFSCSFLIMQHALEVLLVQGY